MLESFKIIPEDIEYKTASFKSFIVREVCKDGEETGLYHIKVKGGRNANKLFSCLKDTFSDSEVSFIDKTGKLGLDYNIYVLIKDELTKTCAIGIFEEIDKQTF